MESKFIFCLAFILCVGLFGCATAVIIRMRIPIRMLNCRSGSKIIANFILLFHAKCLKDSKIYLPSQIQAIFKLAADNLETKTYALDNSPFYLWVIPLRTISTAAFTTRFEVRRAMAFFLLCNIWLNISLRDKTDCGFELVGIAKR